LWKQVPNKHQEKENTAERNKPSVITKGKQNYYKQNTQTISTLNSQKEGRPEPEASQASQAKESSQPSRAEESARISAA
jgi:hypothetical protein